MQQVVKKAYSVYIGVGALGIASLALCVIFSVVMRYCFSITFMWMEELIKVIFAFTTFWGMGACVLGDENIIVDILYARLHGMPKKIASIISHLAVLAVNGFMLVLTLQWIKKSGDYLSKGLVIPYTYIYAVMPVGIIICILCTVIILMGDFKRRAAEY